MYSYTNEFKTEQQPLTDWDHQQTYRNMEYPYANGNGGQYPPPSGNQFQNQSYYGAQGTYYPPPGAQTNGGYPDASYGSSYPPPVTSTPSPSAPVSPGYYQNSPTNGGYDYGNYQGGGQSYPNASPNWQQQQQSYSSYPIKQEEPSYDHSPGANSYDSSNSYQHPRRIHHSPSPNNMHFMGYPQEQPPPQQHHLSPPGSMPLPGMKRPMGYGSGGGGRPGGASNKKQKESQQPKITEHLKEEKKPKVKRTANRFNGMSEEEVAKRGLPDYLQPGLDIVFIGINPSMFAAYTGKYYDGPGNHFWQALYLSGLIPEPMSAGDDHKMVNLGYGFTNVVARTTRGIADLSKKEIAEGAVILKEKLIKYQPKIAVFNGKAIYEVYSGQKKFMFGRQPQRIPGSQTWLWVMPSSSARCAQLPRVADKVPFFLALKKFRDHLNGLMPELDEAEIVFSNVMLKNAPSKKIVKTEPLEYHEQNVPPDLEPVTDGIPANVPESVSTVIEDVIRKFTAEVTNGDACSSSCSESSPATSLASYHSPQHNTGYNNGPPPGIGVGYYE